MIYIYIWNGVGYNVFFDGKTSVNDSTSLVEPTGLDCQRVTFEKITPWLGACLDSVVFDDVENEVGISIFGFVHWRAKPSTTIFKEQKGTL